MAHSFVDELPGDEESGNSRRRQVTIKNLGFTSSRSR